MQEKTINDTIYGLKEENKLLRESRAALVLSLRESGYTLDQIGEIFGITRERTRQIEHKEMRRKRMGQLAQSPSPKPEDVWRNKVPVRLYNCLARSGIKSENDLILALRSGLQKPRNFGWKCFAELENLLPFGYTIRMDSNQIIYLVEEVSNE